MATAHGTDLANAPTLAQESVRFQADALHLSARTVLARFARFGDFSDLTMARLWLAKARALVGADTTDAAAYLDSLAAGLASVSSKPMMSHFCRRL